MSKANVRTGRTAVVVVNYDGAEDTAQCVKYLLDVEVQVDLVVVDNA